MGKGRFTINPFENLALTPSNMEDLEQIATTLVDDNLAKYEHFLSVKLGHVDSTRWKLVKSKGHTRVYSERQERARRGSLPSHKRDATSQLPALLCLGTSVGDLDDVMFGVVSPTLEIMRVKASYVNDLSGAAVLSTIVKPTLEDPFRSVVVKWMELDIPLQSTGLVKNRDYVYVEATGFTHLSNGERVGYHILHSVQFPQTHDLPDRIRANMSICAFFRQAQRNAVDIYVTGVMDPAGGDNIRRLAIPNMANAFLSTLKYAHCGQMKKLAWVLENRYKESTQNGAPIPERICVSCAKAVGSRRLGDFRKSNSTCKLCFGFVCNACKFQKKLSFVTPDLLLAQRKVSFCRSLRLLLRYSHPHEPNPPPSACEASAVFRSLQIARDRDEDREKRAVFWCLERARDGFDPMGIAMASCAYASVSSSLPCLGSFADLPLRGTSSSFSSPHTKMLRRFALRSVQTTVRNARAFNAAAAAEQYKNPRGAKFSMTKIVATIGPVSESMDMTQRLTDEGLRIMRINFSHAEYDEAAKRISNLRACRGVHFSDKQNFNLRAVLHDTKGPEIRTGKMLNGKKITLEKGKEVVLTTDRAFEEKGTADKFYVTYDELAETVKVGDTVLLSDGLIRLTCTAVGDGEVTCMICNTEEIGNRKGVNLPGLIVELPALSDKDRRDLDFGVQHDIDFIAASFIRKASDVHEIRDFVAQCIKKHWAHEPSYIAPKIISKVENLEGIQNFDEILEASDGIMCARGDLGVEVPLQKVLTYQKHMVEKCNAVGKPVIVATQMLESMQNNPRPTRAEVSDVGNAVLDGADCVMLSGESAQGKYPIESVSTMMTVIKEADSLLLEPATRAKFHFAPPTSDVESIVSSAVKTADEMKAQLLIVLTDTGYTARKVAKYKPTVPVMCFTQSKKVGRQLQIHRGLYPVVPVVEDRRPTTAEAIVHAKNLGWIVSGDRVVVLSGDKLSDDLGKQIVLRVADVA
ncbi:hypothetical protein BBJ28_00000448 [Nothophytophthora sp. Chile5]|nr:hypothetical protein BBJ28_00000448 [Nothophytophthora sp. Chile5]